MRDHNPLVVTSFRGTFNRGEDETCPAGFFMTSQNIRFIKGGVTTRYGSRESLATPAIERMAIYKRIGEAQRVIYLDSNGNLYDSTNPSTPILTILAMTDFSMVTMFNRAYITPHDGITGLPGEKVYVYEGSGVAVGAAGSGPTNPLMALESAFSGHVEPGLRVIAVAFETISGFITKPGGFATVTSTGAFTISVSQIEIGGSRVVARHLLATKRIVDFNGDFQAQTYYSVVRIDNNTDEGPIYLDFYDADLQADATHLLEELAEIPAGVGITNYRGRLVVWGENLNVSVGRVSGVGEPESMNEVEGFFTVNPGAGGGIKNCWEYRSQLYIQKAQQTYVTSDNGQEAILWEVISVDMSVGAECHSVAKSLDFGENIEDRVFVGDRSGIKVFNGSFAGEPLTYNIDDIWGDINLAAFHTVELVIDPINCIIYAAIPIAGAVTPNAVIYGDYSEGLTPDTVRWTTHAFASYPARTIAIDLVAGQPVFKFGSRIGNIYEVDPTLLLDDGFALNQFVEFPFFPTGDTEDLDDLVHNFTGIKMRIKGQGNLDITLAGLDRVNTFTTQQLVLSATPGFPVFVGFNFNSERCSVKLQLTEVSNWFILNKFTIYLVALWEDRPA